MTSTDKIFPTEKIRYPDRARWGWNNGFRLRWLENGKNHARIINAARAGNIEALLDYAKEVGGVTQPKTFARSALRAAAKLKGDIPSYRIVSHKRQTGNIENLVCIPYLSWTYRGNRQVAKIEWVPMWCVEIHRKR